MTGKKTKILLKVVNGLSMGSMDKAAATASLVDGGLAPDTVSAMDMVTHLLDDIYKSTHTDIE
jgi:hypothetical protein